MTPPEPRQAEKQPSRTFFRENVPHRGVETERSRGKSVNLAGHATPSGPLHGTLQGGTPARYLNGIAEPVARTPPSELKSYTRRNPRRSSPAISGHDRTRTVPPVPLSLPPHGNSGSEVGSQTDDQPIMHGTFGVTYVADGAHGKSRQVERQRPMIESEAPCEIRGQPEWHRCDQR